MDKDLTSIQEARDCIQRSKAAGEVLTAMDQAGLDKLVAAIAQTGREHARELARMAVKETGFGVVEHKVIKNLFAANQVYEAIRGQKVVGLLGRNERERTWDFGVPVGVVAALVPSTNPTSTVLYKAMIALKAGNTVVFSPHPGALKCILRAVELVREAVERAGGPADAVTAIHTPTLEGTKELMGHRDTRLILATGGGGMVKAAYSSGTPAIGVGAGNGPAYFHPSCDLAKSVKRVMDSKTFDNGTVCASEQSVVVERRFAGQVEEEFRRQGGYFLSREQRDILGRFVLRSNGTMNPAIVGKPMEELCRLAGLTGVPGTARVFLVPEEGVGKGYPFSNEKLGLILAYYVEEDEDACLRRCVEILRHEGAGHTFAIHAQDDGVVEKFAKAVPASRVLVNTPASLGGIGATTDLFPALTLGCGAVGGSSTSNNIGPMDLVNIKRVAWGKRELEELKGGEDVCPNKNSCGETGNSNSGSISQSELTWIIREALERLR